MGCPDLSPDILPRVHFYVEKEAILQASQKKADLADKGHTVQIYQDQAPSTLWRRRDFCPVTHKLGELNIRYQWGHPYALIFMEEGKQKILRSWEEVQRLLNIQPASGEVSPSPPAILYISHLAHPKYPIHCWASATSKTDGVAIFCKASFCA
ncbi:hypothetical protein NDU88_004743 [Pleurodeles waltl]|uniref:Uncharacterized protein n=1 Tax=Pleurodeles waltl TaxID=8319 RepID=A0AAV7SJR4_PLEWA|nr:hypothetical protein NDU88_004743 [Pleurodeles waltl]